MDITRFTGTVTTSFSMSEVVDWLVLDLTVDTGLLRLVIIPYSHPDQLAGLEVTRAVLSQAVAAVTVAGVVVAVAAALARPVVAVAMAAPASSTFWRGEVGPCSALTP